MKIKSNTIDIIAAASSIICAVHCAIIPIVLTFSSLGSLHFLKNPYIELTFIWVGLIFVITSLWPSYKKVHRRAKPLIFAAIGFGFIALGRLHFTELWEILNTVIGATFVALAHYKNYLLIRQRGGHKH